MHLVGAYMLALGIGDFVTVLLGWEIWGGYRVTAIEFAIAAVAYAIAYYQLAWTGPSL